MKKQLKNSDFETSSYKQTVQAHFFYLQLSNKQKAYPQTLKFLPIPPNIPMTPIYTKKQSH